MEQGGRAAGLLKSTGIFAVGTFGAKVLTLLITPLFTHYIDPAGMGKYDMLYTVVSLLQPIAVLSIPESLFRWILDESKDKGAVVSTWRVLLGVLVMLFSAAYIPIWLVFRFEHPVLIYLLVIGVSVYSGAQYGTRGLHNNKLFAFSGVLYSLIYCVVSFVLVVAMGAGYLGMLYAMLAATFGGACVLLAVQPQLLRPSCRIFDRAMAKGMLRYSIFLLPNQLSWWALSWVGRLFIVGFLGYGANGIYSIAMKFPSAFGMISSVFGPAWQEHAVAQFSDSDKDAWFSRIFKMYSSLLGSTLLVGIPLTKIFIVFFIEESYAGAFDIVTLLYFGALFSAFSTFYGVMYLCARDTRGAASTTVLGGATTAVLSLLLIPLLGLVGAAIASMSGNLVVWVARLVQTRRYSVIAPPYSRIVILLSLNCVITAVITAFDSIAVDTVLAVIGAFAAVVINRSALSGIRGMFQRA